MTKYSFSTRIQSDFIDLVFLTFECINDENYKTLFFLSGTTYTIGEFPNAFCPSVHFSVQSYAAWDIEAVIFVPFSEVRDM